MEYIKVIEMDETEHIVTLAKLIVRYKNVPEIVDHLTRAMTEIEMINLGNIVVIDQSVMKQDNK